MTEDARGVLWPDRLPRLTRIPPPEGSGEVVRWVWISQWCVPSGETSRQELLAFPACNLVVEAAVVGVSGPTTRLSHRDLTGIGWGVGALLRPAAVPAVVGDPQDLRDRYEVREHPELVASVGAVMGPPGRPADDGVLHRAAAVLADWVVAQVGELGPEHRLANALSEVADSDRSVRHLEDLASRTGAGPRTLQRVARRYVGVPPAAMIRRRRVQDAAQAIREDPGADLAALAADLGYADQSHLHRDFSRVLGLTPGRYRAQSRAT